MKCSDKNLNVFLLKVHVLHHIFCTKNIMFLNNYIFEKKEHNTVNLCYIITPTSWIYKNMELDD